MEYLCCFIPKTTPGLGILYYTWNDHKKHPYAEQWFVNDFYIGTKVFFYVEFKPITLSAVESYAVCALKQYFYWV